MGEKTNRWWNYFGYAAKLLVVFIFVFPFLWMFSVSLQNNDEITAIPITLIPSIPQWGNYVEAFTSGPFLQYLGNSVIIIVSIIVIQMAVMIPAAYGFAKYEFKGKNFLFGLVMLAFMTPVQLTFLPIYNMMSKAGLMDTLLPQILPSMTNAFGIFLLRQYFMQIPDELIESAKLDHAGSLKIILKLMLPMSKPALTSIILFSFVGHWNDYFWPLVMTNSEQYRPLTMYVEKIRDVEQGLDWSLIMAANCLLVLPVLIVFIFASKKIIQAFAYNGMK